MFFVQEIVHNKGVCYMYLKEPEKVCKFMQIILTNSLQLQVYCICNDSEGLRAV